MSSPRRPRAVLLTVNTPGSQRSAVRAALGDFVNFFHEYLDQDLPVVPAQPGKVIIRDNASSEGLLTLYVHLFAIYLEFTVYKR